MRKLIASAFTSLDGVIQAPGGPNEDTTGNFTLGGWLFSFDDEEMDISGAGFDGRGRDLVLGRRTYEIFEAYWPYQSEDNQIAATLNAAKKYVATRTLSSLEWRNSEIIKGDVVSAVAALKSQPGLDLQIIGSADLIQTLHGATLIDEYNLWIYPVVLGHGKRLFGTHAKASALRLVTSKVSKSGVVMNTYIPAGDIPPSSRPPEEPSIKERSRREKWSKEVR